MRKIIVIAVLCVIFAPKVGANTVTLDSVQGQVASATAYAHGIIDSGDAQLIYKWDFLPNFLNENFVPGSVVSGTFSTTDVILYLPPNYTLYFKVATVQGMDTTWGATYKQAFIADTPVTPIFYVTSTTPSLSGATEGYFYNSGNTTTTVTPYISYVGPTVGFFQHASFALDELGDGTGNYLWNGLPTGFTFWRYYLISNSVGTITSDTISITTLSAPAPAWVGILSIESPADSIKVGALVMGNTLSTVVTLHFSANGITDSVSKTISGANLQDTVWLTASGLGMETTVTFDVCAYNSIGGMCTNSLTATTDTKLLLEMNSFHATGWSTGDAKCTIHVPNNETAYEGFILSTDAAHLNIIDQASVLTPHYSTDTFTISLSNMYDGTEYYLYLYGNATDGEMVDTTFEFDFDALVTGIEYVEITKAVLWCDGAIVMINVATVDKLTIFSSTGLKLEEINLRPGRENVNIPLLNGVYFYQFGSGTSGKFALIR